MRHRGLIGGHSGHWVNGMFFGLLLGPVGVLIGAGGGLLLQHFERPERTSDAVLTP